MEFSGLVELKSTSPLDYQGSRRGGWICRALSNKCSIS